MSPARNVDPLVPSRHPGLGSNCPECAYPSKHWSDCSRYGQDAAADSLDAPWRDAVAALPEGWQGPWIGPGFLPGEPPWHAWAYEDADPTTAYGSTPHEALRALTAELRELA